MKKKMMLVALILLIVTGIVFANGASEPASSSTAGAKKYRVAFVARAQADSFAAWLANSVVAEAKKYPNIELSVFDGQASDDIENSMIENCIANKFDCIIIQPNNGESQRPYAEKVVAAGIKCITTNARISGINGASSVDANPYEQAAVNARVAVTQIPKNANVVVLLGPPGNFHADQRRVSWQKEFFDKRPDVKIVGEQIANWNKDEAMSHMEDWVQANSKIDAIISMNDNMCAGALEVIKDMPEYKNILSYGVDGTVEACLLIKDGKMTSTCLQSAFDLATNLLATSEKILTGQEKQIDMDIDCPLVNKDNVDEYLEMYKRAGYIK
ncbi:MAG: sugar ABC transporter substrate-binding protein [Sphaerochaetaceae bacterium]